MKNKTKDRSKEIQSHVFVFKLLYIIPEFVFFPYYYILLYKATKDPSVFFIERSVFFLGMLLGFIIFSFVIDRIGYLRAFRASMLLQAIVMLIVVLLINNVSDVFLVFGLITGLAKGTFWAVYNLILLKELHGINRGKVIELVQSMTAIVSIILPITAGALVDFNKNGLKFIGMLLIILFLIGALIPFKYNKKPKSKIRSEEFTRILSQRGIIKYLSIISLEHGFLQVIVAIFHFVPYLLIGSEFGVGGLVTLASLLAAVLAYRERKTTIGKKILPAYLGLLLSSITTLLFLIFWTIPTLAIRGLAITIKDSTYIPAREELRNEAKEKILKDYRNESALEMNIIEEFSIGLFRILISAAMFLLVKTLFVEKINEDDIRVLIGIIFLYPFITFTLLVRLHKNRQL